MDECRGRRVRPLTAALSTTLVLAACAQPGTTLESQPAVAVTRIQTTLHDPVWSYTRHTVIAPTDDDRLAEISDLGAPEAHTRLSAPMAVGRNIQISGSDNSRVFVPEPARNRVAVVDLASLQQVEDFDAGPAPAVLAEDRGMRILLALSADGSSVTPVDVEGFRKLATARFGQPATAIDGANRGRDIEYHLYGPSGIRFYKGPSSPPEKRGDLDLDVATAAGDGTKVTRSYVADQGRTVLYAVDSRRGGEGLQVVGRAQVPSPIRYLGTDDTRIYAATDAGVVVFDSATVTGYPHGKITTLRTIDYRTSMPPGPAKTAPLSGMAVAQHRVYLTLKGQPFVISVGKPRL
ncbi:hypothetical protein MCNS_25280 [Mycobacterium conspicuum]|uniref:Lipoprotein n=1 Tax=Mycobacterium conspicuum TaxID=44010 RepID=A0A7I7YCK8_9MYCO|nr:hypothetical protein MCNS_25280 [Mycobacterium conspicuum]